MAQDSAAARGGAPPLVAPPRLGIECVKWHEYVRDREEVAVFYKNALKFRASVPRWKHQIGHVSLSPYCARGELNLIYNVSAQAVQLLNLICSVE